MSGWDQRSASALARMRDTAVREQIRDVVAPFSPFWKERLAASGVKPGSISKVRDLAKVPAVGERDVCPDGDPAKAARLVVQATETGYALHAPGPSLRKAMWRRLVDLDAYRRQIDVDTRATSYVMDGLGLQFPLASTRSDLDVVARAGARLWQVLGLSTSDILVSAVPVGPRTEHVGLQLAALAAGSPAMFPGADLAGVAATLRLVPATVLAVATHDAARVIDELADMGAPLSALRSVLLVGAPSPTERAAAQQALDAAGLSSAAVLGVHAPSGARLLWGECRPSASGTSAGYHTYPDLDVVQLVDPESGETVDGVRGGEVVLTQLGMRGSALLRWRTGDLVDAAIETGQCPACRRLVPRVPSTVQRRALVASYLPRDGRLSAVDFRGVAGALLGRPDVADWRAVLRQSERHGADELLIHVMAAPGADPAEMVVAAAKDLRSAAGTLPSQLVAADPAGLAAVDATALDGDRGLHRLTARVLTRA